MADRNTASDFEDFEKDSDFDLNEYLRRYLRYWYLFPIFVGMALTAAFFYLKVTQPQYLTKTTLLIKDNKKGASAGPEDILKELTQFSGNKLVENEIQILASHTMMEQVVKELNLEVAYQASDGLGTLELYRRSPVSIKSPVITEFGYQEPMVIHVVDGKSFTMNTDDDLLSYGKLYKSKWGAFTVEYNPEGDTLQKDVIVSFKNVKGLTENMVKRLQIAQPNIKSTVIELSFEDASTQRGIDVLNKLLDVYVQSSINDKNSEASNTLKFIEDRLGLITGELGDVEKDVEVYKSQKGLTDIGSESQIYLESMKENDSKLNEVNIQIQVLEGVENYIKSNISGAPAPASYMINDPLLVSLLSKFQELEMQRERYARTTQAGNPLMETIHTQLASTKQAIRDNVQNLRRGLDLTRQNLQGINSRFSAGLRSIPQKEREYVGIKRQQTIKENLYLYLLQKREETALAYASTVTDSRLVDAPIATYNPVKPKKTTIALGALAAGLAIPVLLINLLFMLNNTVQRREEIEKSGHVAVLGEIGKLKKNVNESTEVVKMTSRSAVAEQFRALRTNLQYLGDGSCRVIMFTSSIGGEGKSFISVNLAASLAYSDKKVIVLGADLRKPTLHERVPVSNDRGLTNYLIGQNDLSKLIQPSGIHDLFHVMPSGPIPPNPSELLSNGRFPKLISELKEVYDYILVDSPPYGLVTDSALLTDYVDATLYLVRFNYTIKDHLKRIHELARSKRFANLSVVFNAVNYGAGYGSAYGYGGYGYGYYSEDQDSKASSVGDRVRKLIKKK